jgi:transcriptional regulator with XRE-family HTH domain
MVHLGQRLREERVRVGLSQTELAAVGGLQQRAQLNYESGARSPDANYLLALKSVGVDIVYVLTGQRAALAGDVADRLDDDEREIVRKYRMLNEAGKGAVEAAMNGYLMAGIFTSSGEPDKRVRRLAANRAAALDTETSELVRRAQDVQRQKEQGHAKTRSSKDKC